jgi:transposase
MSLYFQATMTRVWSPVGQTPPVCVSPQRDYVHYYGAVNLLTGHEVTLPVPQLNSATTAHFIEHLTDCYPQRPLLLLLDRATWHKRQSVADVLARHPQLHIVFFPPACPQLNPQERVWSKARAAVSHNHTFRNFAALKKAFFDYLSNTLFPFDWLTKFAPSILCQS